VGYSYNIITIKWSKKMIRITSKKFKGKVYIGKLLKSGKNGFTALVNGHKMTFNNGYQYEPV